ALDAAANPFVDNRPGKLQEAALDDAARVVGAKEVHNAEEFLRPFRVTAAVPDEQHRWFHRCASRGLVSPLPPGATAVLFQYSTPFCALTPARYGCLTSFISVTRSARSINSSRAFRPVTTTCSVSRLRRSSSSTSSSGR